MEPKPGPCSIAPDDEVFERYLRHELSEDQRETFELHYLECPACQETLETYRAITRELGGSRRMPAALPPQGVTSRTYAPWIWGLAAAAVLVAAVVIQRRSIEPRPAPQEIAVAPPPSAPAPAVPAPSAVAPEPRSQNRDALMLLARFEPPSYTPPALRSTNSDADAAFARAMTSYSAGDYASARPALEAIVATGSKAPGPHFFLAISDLLLDRTNEGIAGLRRTIGLGDTAYLEDARFYLGKSLVRAGDLAGAERELQAVVDMDGDRRVEAAAIVTLLRGGR